MKRGTVIILRKGTAQETARMGQVGTPISKTGARANRRKFAVHRENVPGFRDADVTTGGGAGIDDDV